MFNVASYRRSCTVSEIEDLRSDKVNLRRSRLLTHGRFMTRLIDNKFEFWRPFRLTAIKTFASFVWYHSPNFIALIRVGVDTIGH